MMSVIDSTEFAKRKRQKKIDKEQTEDEIYREKIADLVENMLTDAAYIMKEKNIHLDHFLMEVWMQSSLLALRFFMVEASDNQVADTDSKCIELSTVAVDKLQELCRQAAIEAMENLYKDQ
jgi:hypothetical protein